MRDLNDKQYSFFTADERLLLTVSALAMEDVGEVERLQETCPCRSYEAQDLNYSDMMNSIRSIISLFFMECVRLYNLIQKIEVFLLEEDVFIIKVKDDSSGESVKIKWEYLKKCTISKLKSLFEGFSQFCQQAGLNKDELIKTVPLKYAHLDVDCYLHADIDIDAEYVLKAKTMFSDFWSF